MFSKKIILNKKIIKLVYGPSQSFKTLFVLSCLKNTKEKAYIALGKHRFYLPKGFKIFSPKDIVEEIDIMLRLPLELGYGYTIVYDGYGANLQAARALFRESAIMRVSFSINFLAKRYNLEYGYNFIIIGVELPSGKPMFWRTLSQIIDVVLRTRLYEEERKLVIEMLNRNLELLRRDIINLDELLEVSNEVFKRSSGKNKAQYM